ncbi:hypothetical protein DICVIV_05788 [Dictyocaulus viviparus]|uniref:Uncharacterized protein n=1 Tax=Dictyocaulus viviparus TaxID=29172 RepID=A0A0D8XWH3_DICVI|nr:hypothetical protein DICVIV_05788 [Dictyocaulus viviparus]
MTPESTRIQEVVLDRQNGKQINGEANSKPPVVETSEVVDSCGCPINLRVVKDALNEVPPEYKETAFSLSLVIISLMGLFFSIVLYRYLHHLYIPEPEGWFCRNFGELFAPLFDFLCETEPIGGFFHEMKRNSQILASELQDAASNFIQSLLDGFHAFVTIYSKMIEGFVVNIDSGIQELMENVRQNIAFLFRFCGQFVHAISYFIVRCAQSMFSIFHTVAEDNEL